MTCTCSWMPLTGAPRRSSALTSSSVPRFIRELSCAVIRLSLTSDKQFPMLTLLT